MDRLTVLLSCSAAVVASVLAWLLLGAEPADPVIHQLGTAEIHLALPGPGSVVQLATADGVLVEGLFAVGVDRLRVRVTSHLTEAEAARLADQEQALLHGLYEDHQAPYPGALSTTLQCPPALEPQPLDAPERAAFLLSLHANDRFAYGGCAEDLLTWVATVGAFPDPERGRLVRVEYFEPKGNTGRGEAVLRSLDWSRP
jgi:hypothetical protein